VFLLGGILGSVGRETGVLSATSPKVNNASSRLRIRRHSATSDGCSTPSLLTDSSNGSPGESNVNSVFIRITK